MILIFILCYKISPIIFTITIILCRHVTNITSGYKISPIIFTITFIFCRHVTNVTNVTSRYKISPIIFTITIIFADMLQTLLPLHHVTRSPPYRAVECFSVQSRYKIFPIIFTITIIFCWNVTKVTNVTSRYKISPILGYRAPLDAMNWNICLFTIY